MQTVVPGTCNNACNNSSNNDDLLARYQRARVLMQADSGARKLALNTGLVPHWVGDSQCFWYSRETATGHEFRWVNATEASNKPAFDHGALATALAAAANENVDPAQLPLSHLAFSFAPFTLSFTAFGKQWCYREPEQRCEAVESYSPLGRLSPDGCYDAFVRDFNLWVKDVETGAERALTTDGEKFYRYGSEPTAFGYEAAPVLDFLWSPDSQQLLTQLIDTRKLKTAPALVEHVPGDGSLRPSLHNADRKLALPGDEHTEMWQLLRITIHSGQQLRAEIDPLPMVYPIYQGYFDTGRGWWDTEGRHAYFVQQSIERTETRLLKWDTHSNKISELFREDPSLDCPLMPTSHIRTLLMPLPASNELIWYSERSGWAHLYLYDLDSGQLKNPITQGDWLVRGVLHYKPECRELLIKTANRIAGRNPYYCDICRVNIDTGELTPVISTDHDYSVQDAAYASEPVSLGVSPCGDFIVATQARIDEAPASLLLEREGRPVITLETADISAMPAGWRWPEPVMVKAADQQTDIHGIIFRPSDFDPEKSYPLIDLSWGHSTPITPFTGGWQFYGALAWAELGFIVVKFGNRGGGLRHKAFREGIDPTLPHYNKDDCAAAIRQLAARDASMDLSRVGVASSMLYPEALTGLLIHADLYRVGVDINPMSDPRLMPVIGNFGGGTHYPSHEQFVQNLKGKLLLIHGMMEDVVLVAPTFRLVEALQNAHKTVDMLLLPKMNHLGPFDYATRRSWDYMVTHLLGQEPPMDFDMKAVDPVESNTVEASKPATTAEA